MDRFTGYWWSPDSRAIAYEAADLSPVEVLHIMDPTHPEREPEGWRFPRVGTKNAIVRLGVVPITGGLTMWIPWDRDHYPYLASVHWTKNAPLTVGVIDRRQSEYLVFTGDPATGATHPLLTERDAAWINLEQSVPRWLEDGSGFLWMTERGGAWQLELRGRDGKLERSLTRPDLGLRNLVGVDDAARVAWIEAGDDPTQVQIYRVPFGAGGGGPQRVTRDAGVHSGMFGKRSRVWVHGFEGPTAGPVKRVENVDGTVVGELASAAERPTLETHVHFVTVGARHIRGAVIEPEGFDPHASYPVIVSVYGGPHSQMVVQSHHRYLLDQWIANHGFVVVSFDGRGTPSRGRAWERAIRHNLIDVPLNDQVEALQALGREMPQLDLTRVGIYGWSFGGYFSAMAAMRRPDVFRAGVAGAPVADFRDYDTFYTERYLDLPERNAAGYRASSVLTYADKLERPLLIVHGTSDDNVYFLHSLKLCDALFRAGKPYEFMPLAGFTHMVPDPLVTSRLYGRVEAFFEKNVAQASTPMGERAER
jgi:dipeptidyl-peptidase-4